MTISPDGPQSATRHLHSRRPSTLASPARSSVAPPKRTSLPSTTTASHNAYSIAKSPLAAVAFSANTIGDADQSYDTITSRDAREVITNSGSKQTARTTANGQSTPTKPLEDRVSQLEKLIKPFEAYRVNALGAVQQLTEAKAWLQNFQEERNHRLFMLEAEIEAIRPRLEAIEDGKQGTTGMQANEPETSANALARSLIQRLQAGERLEATTLQSLRMMIGAAFDTTARLPETPATDIGPSGQDATHDDAAMEEERPRKKRGRIESESRSLSKSVTPRGAATKVTTTESPSTDINATETASGSKAIAQQSNSEHEDGYERKLPSPTRRTSRASRPTQDYMEWQAENRRNRGAR